MTKHTKLFTYVAFSFDKFIKMLVGMPVNI